ncbi:hypothetical protein SALBM311S_12992 [Streptomyces alboniger]
MPVTNSSRAPLLASTSAASAPLKRVFSGTRTTPADTAPRAETIQSSELGAQIPTRSPVRSPLATHAAAARSTRAPSSPYETRVRPSTTASVSAYRSAADRTRSGMLPRCMSARTTSLLKPLAD